MVDNYLQKSSFLIQNLYNILKKQIVLKWIPAKDNCLNSLDYSLRTLAKLLFLSYLCFAIQSGYFYSPSFKIFEVAYFTLSYISFVHVWSEKEKLSQL